MRLRRVHIGLIAAMLVSSIGFKFIFEKRTDFNRFDRPFVADLRSAFEQKGYQIIDVGRPTMLQAYKHPCFISAGIARVDGGTESDFDANYAALGRKVFLYRGVISDATPHLFPLLDRYVFRIESLYNKTSRIYPIYQFILNSDCPISEISSVRVEGRFEP